MDAALPVKENIVGLIGRLCSCFVLMPFFGVLEAPHLGGSGRFKRLTAHAQRARTLQGPDPCNSSYTPRGRVDDEGRLQPADVRRPIVGGNADRIEGDAGIGGTDHPLNICEYDPCSSRFLGLTRPVSMMVTRGIGELPAYLYSSIPR